MLNNKQIKYLKSLAHSLKAIYQIGKDGITDNMINDILNYLKKHEIVKVKFLQNCEISSLEAIEKFNDAKIEVVQNIGGILVLYKRNDKLKDKIKLP